MIESFFVTKGYFMELRVTNQLDEKTESIIKSIIGAAIDVHRELGPGYLEKVYEQALSLELKHRGLVHSTQMPVAVNYKEIKIHGQVLDMVVESKVVVELKSEKRYCRLMKLKFFHILNQQAFQLGS